MRQYSTYKEILRGVVIFCGEIQHNMVNFSSRLISTDMTMEVLFHTP